MRAIRPTSLKKRQVIPHSLCPSRALRYRFASLRDGLKATLDGREFGILGSSDAKASKMPLRLFQLSFKENSSELLATKCRCRRQRISALGEESQDSPITKFNMKPDMICFSINLKLFCKCSSFVLHYNKKKEITDAKDRIRTCSCYDYPQKRC